MTLPDIAAVGSLVGGLAVVASVIYLAVQVRQAERNQRAALQQGRAARNSELLLRCAEPDFVTAFMRGGDCDSAILPVEFQQFQLIFRAFIVGVEDTLIHHQEGLLPDTALESLTDTLRATFALPGWRAMWRERPVESHPRVSAYIDRILAEAPPAPAADRLSRWRSIAVSTPSAHGPDFRPGLWLADEAQQVVLGYSSRRLVRRRGQGRAPA